MFKIYQISMKNHSVPAPVMHMAPEGGVVKTFWQKHAEKALAHQEYRAIHLARTNPDYQIKYPNECRDNPDRKILECCHPEAHTRILEEHEKILRLSVVPAVDRPTRLNRVG